MIQLSGPGLLLTMTDTTSIRPRVQGKFVFLGDEKVYLRGVTYGTFRPDKDGNSYPAPAPVERDFRQMTANGINAVRTYTVPPRWFLDKAQAHGLHVMVGLPWEQHVAFLDDKKRADSIEERVRAGVRACAGHPAVLCYTIGNEIPATMVRWYGRRRVERFLERLYRAAKAEDPAGLVTYVNFPSTEYLQLPFIDFVCFNVYLEEQESFEAYLARLQNLAGDRPLVMAEIGLDSRRNGEFAQAEALDWQVRTAFAAGCAGAFIFAWTDEWHRGGQDIDDWDFGLTDRQRRPKMALAAVRQAFTEVPFPDQTWPLISVVVCSYNGAGTIGDCLAGLMRLEYRNFEVIVVDDGSTDQTAVIAAQYPVRLVRVPNRGLSHARNTGMQAAAGDIVAYIDDDAYPDPHWLTYLATTFVSTSHAAVGGPNITAPDDGPIADCVGNAPGGPIHVLLSDLEAEHIPGCNLAIRKACLKEIGGFDPQFCVAGDDVDVCWRLQQQGWTLGYNPAAVVWHHRRSSIRAYWRQQQGYGKAEALLAQKWPERYSAAGYLSWAGRIYGQALMQRLGWRREQINYGPWGTGLFQSIYQPAPGLLGSLPQMPEWYLIIIVLAALAALGIFWTPLLLALPLLLLAGCASLIQAALGAAQATFPGAPPSRAGRLKQYSLTAFLHLLQPLARLHGRLRHGLTPWRRSANGRALPWPQTLTVWSERWQAVDTWLHSLEATVKAAGACICRGGSFDRWDLEVRGGLYGSARLQMVIEEHGAGKQLARFRTWPRPSMTGMGLTLACGALAAGAILDLAWEAGVILGLAAIVLIWRTLLESAAATATILQAVNTMNGKASQSRQPATATRSAHPVLRSLRYLRPHWKLATVSVTIIILTSLIALLEPWPLKILIDSVLGNHPLPPLLNYALGALGHDRVVLLLMAVLVGFGIVLLGNAINVLESYVNTRIDQQIVLDFRSDLFRHAQRLSLTFHERERAGMTIYAINFQAHAAAQLIMAIPPLAQSLLTLVGMIWITYHIDRQLALLSLTVVPFLYYAVGYYVRHIQKRLYEVKMMEAETLSIIHEAMSMLRVIVAFGRENHEYRRFRNQGERALYARVKLTVRQTLFSLSVNTTTAGGTALVLGFGAYAALRGRITPGDLLVIIAYVAAVYKPLETISSTIGSLQDQLVALRFAYNLMDTEPEIKDAPNALAIAQAQGHIAFAGVHFSYKGRANTLKNISFAAEAGEVIALVGPTGAGKTTLISLIPRFYQPQRGQILLDGVDIRKLTLESLRQQISIVLQEPLLFSGSIADNIRYGRLDATMDEIIQAARDANAHDFIMRLPHKYRTRLGERGLQLSGGERQRISVARAFLKDAPILLLDEPTSAIDSKTEAVILEALDRLMAGRTTFMVAHRLSTIRNADRILVLNQGELVEQGTHDELLAHAGLYKQLHDMQTRQAQRKSRLLAAVSEETGAAGRLVPPANGRVSGADEQVSALISETLQEVSFDSLDLDAQNSRKPDAPEAKPSKPPAGRRKE
ncbi:MAG TPA: ATP-binding cassette domain-containing protein [Anaerolineae bacterium]